MAGSARYCVFQWEIGVGVTCDLCYVCGPTVPEIMMGLISALGIHSSSQIKYLFACLWLGSLSLAIQSPCASDLHCHWAIVWLKSKHFFFPQCSHLWKDDCRAKLSSSWLSIHLFIQKISTEGVTMWQAPSWLLGVYWCTQQTWPFSDGAYGVEKEMGKSDKCGWGF